MGERVSVREAAEILGMSVQGVREHMKRNLFEIPIGYVTNPSKRKFQYHIYRDMLNRHLGKENDKKGGGQDGFNRNGNHTVSG